VESSPLLAHRGMLRRRVMMVAHGVNRTMNPADHWLREQTP